MHFRRLEYFVAVSEELSFRRAAKRVGISQPALTKQIAALEAELGCDLLIREGRRIVGLTPSGVDFIGKTRHVLAYLEQAARSAASIAEGKQGRLRLGVCEDAATKILACVLAVFRVRLPNIDFEVVELSSAGMGSALRQNDIDIGLVVPPIESGSLAVEPLWHEDLCVALPEAHSLIAREQIACSDLEGVDLIMAHSQLAAGGHDYVRDVFRAAGMVPRISSQTLRRSTRIMLVAAGLGATFVPASLVSTSIAGIVMRPFATPSMTIAAAYRAEDPPGSAMRFLRIAREVLGVDP
jgi:DNA-binding transcriptional LysR family regulator